MKFTFSEDDTRWWDELTGDDRLLSAGRLPDSYQHQDGSSNRDERSRENRLVFGRLVYMLRCRDGLTIEAFAEQQDIDVGEVIGIESDPDHLPDARTVYEIATNFKLSVPKLMELSGILNCRDSEMAQNGLKFAARSEAPEKLTKEQLHVLEEFVHVLGHRD